MSGLPTVATCRHCRRELRGAPYHTGQPAYFPLPEGGRVPACYYGGWVCSRSCDWKTCLELEQSMPGHGIAQQRPGQDAMRRINANWPDEAHA